MWKDITLRMNAEMEKLQSRSPPNPYQGENPKGKPGAEALQENLGGPSP